MILQKIEDLSNLRITVMGLGLNGGGVASAKFLAAHGAKVTVTDTKSAADLAVSLEELAGLGIRFVLGRHDEVDFSNADIVVKNPAVRPDNPFLKHARSIETDLSLFLRFCPARIAAVTGSKGKSTTSSALAWMLSNSGIKTYLGGNITVSPLSFFDKLKTDDVVVLELSSWQLGDLKGRRLLKPAVAVMTRIVPDHLDRYGTMDAYIADKRLIYADQDDACWTVCDLDDPYGRSFAQETKARVLAYARSLPEASYGIVVPATGNPASGGACLAMLPGIEGVELVPTQLSVPGAHTRRNIAAAALAAWSLGAEPTAIRIAAGTFAGIEHRLEFVRSRRGVRWFNDSAATVPEAVSAAVEAFEEPLVLISGGTDKKLEFGTAREAYRRCAALILLAGSGTEKIRAILDADSIPYKGPYDSITEAVAQAAGIAKAGSTVVLSPGCTSFGMFKNEFDRGRSYKAAVMALPDRSPMV